MNRKIWPKRKPRLERNHFVGWILSTDRPNTPGCPSACTWLIHPLDDSSQQHIDVKTSESEYSDEKRAALAAAIGAVEELKPNSSIILLTRETYVSSGLDLAWEWRENGWKNVKRKKLKNHDLWARLLEVIEERNLDVIIWRWRAREYPTKQKMLRNTAKAALHPRKRGRA